MEATQQQITEALERAEVAAQATDKALEAHDAKQAPALIYETLTLTLEALALCARAGQINPLENLLPNAVFYVRILQTLSADPFTAVSKLKIGSSVGVEPERTDADRIAALFTRLAGGADALSRFAVMLERADRSGSIEA